MKKFLFVLGILFSCFCIAQPENETKNLSKLCKVWGFLKYYAPDVAHGKYNWDSVLAVFIPAVETAKSNVESDTGGSALRNETC